eukprot:362304-Chlamydomonas_euryale.AAC.4
MPSTPTSPSPSFSSIVVGRRCAAAICCRCQAAMRSSSRLPTGCMRCARRVARPMNASCGGGWAVTGGSGWQSGSGWSRWKAVGQWFVRGGWQSGKSTTALRKRDRATGCKSGTDAYVRECTGCTVCTGKNGTDVAPLLRTGRMWRPFCGWDRCGAPFADGADVAPLLRTEPMSRPFFGRARCGAPSAGGTDVAPLFADCRSMAPLLRTRPMWRPFRGRHRRGRLPRRVSTLLPPK